MIEVEKKFFLSEEDKQRLIKNSQFIREETFVDIYYDNKTYDLTKKDRWFRCRKGQYQFKEPLHKSVDRVADQYQEIEDEKEIRKLLKFPLLGAMEDLLKKNGFFPFCTCQTTRKKYKKESFMIDIDDVKADNFTYRLAEIEKIVSSQDQIQQAMESIVLFAKKHQLIFRLVRGKVVDYIKQYRPQHFQALVEAKIVKKEEED